MLALPPYFFSLVGNIRSTSDVLFAVPPRRSSPVAPEWKNVTNRQQTPPPLHALRTRHGTQKKPQLGRGAPPIFFSEHLTPHFFFIPPPPSFFPDSKKKKGGHTYTLT
eukprot:TRINITY_DN3296_c0_g1_i2.p1 TRINITY_DN3296_c0_g1~~TRINITY_DN3296_c0_g1_i2.p1  ORF type:complete len:108 (+),score=4.09 TRINITY_DN3296_c0_g1_i2:138-461(+)